MKTILKTLIWTILSLQVLLILFIIFGRFIGNNENIRLTSEDDFDNVFMPRFEKSEINEEIKQRIMGNSFVNNDDIKLEDLSYLTIAHYKLDGTKENGEMIVNSQIADEVLEIFQTLYEEKYPIENMTLIDNYGTDEYASIEANNTYSFNYRSVDKDNNLTAHAYGLAIDINPIQNPYVKQGTTTHKQSNDYIKRNVPQKGMILENDICTKTFKEHGWTWGGDTTEVIDYQHFEKAIEQNND